LQKAGFSAKDLEGPLLAVREELERLSQVPLDESVDSWTEAFTALTLALGSWGSEFSRVLLKVIRDMQRLNRDVGETIDGLTKMQKLQIAGAGFGIGVGLGGVLEGAAGGAIAGSSFGTTGIVIGGLSGALGGLVSSAQEAKKEAEALAAALEQFGDNVRRAIRQLQDLSPLELALADVQEMILDFVANIQSPLITSPEDINALRFNFNALEPEEILRIVNSWGASLERGSEEWNKWLLLAEFIAERVAELRNEMARIALEFQQDIDVRRLEATGREEEAQRLRLAIAQANELNAARKLVEQGIITEAMFRDLAEVLDLELAAALRDVADAAEEAARATRNLVEDLQVRALTALGFDREAAEIGLAARHRREREEFAGESREVLNLLRFTQDMEVMALQAGYALDAAEQQVKIAKDHLRVAEDQLSAALDAQRDQQDVVDTLRQVRDELEDFNLSLLVNQPSPLSPFQRLQEAQSQFDALVSLARGGDLTAAQSLPDAATTLLDALRDYFGSSVGFANGFNAVRDAIAAVQWEIGAQLSVEERILATLDRRVRIAQRQVTAAERSVTLAEQAAEAAARRHDAAMDLWRTKLNELLQALNRGRERPPVPPVGGNGGRGRPPPPPPPERPRPPPPPPPPPPPRRDEQTEEQTRVLQVGFTQLKASVDELRNEVRSQTTVVSDAAEVGRATSDVALL
jgi:hypothetical protein